MCWYSLGEASLKKPRISGTMSKIWGVGDNFQAAREHADDLELPGRRETLGRFRIASLGSGLGSGDISPLSKCHK